jgi:hypothetical protein
MGEFSYGQAIGAGFRLIGRHPLALLAWSAVYLIFLILPALAFVSYAFPLIIAASREMATHPGRPDPAQLMALRGGMFGWQPVIWLLSIATTTVVMGAMFRAVLEPQSGRWGFLRLGRGELWLGLTLLVLAVMTFIMMFVLFLPLAIGIGVAAAVAQHSGGGVGAGLLVFLFGLAGVCAVLWVLLRLSLALPMSFSRGNFLLYESWDLTRGQSGKMFLVYLALIGGMVLLELAIGFSIVVTMFGHFAMGGMPRGFGADGPPADLFQRYGTVIFCAAVVGSIVATAIRTIFIAPLAEIYRELTAGEGAP